MARRIISGKGFTLLEMMIVVVLVGFLAFLGANTIRGSFKSKSREISWRMASTIRYLYNSAITENKTYRLVFDFENNSYWAESTSERVLLEKGDAEKKDEKKDEKKVSPEAKEDAETTSSDEKAEGSEKVTQISPTEPAFGPVESALMETRALPNGIFIKDVYTGKTAATSGKAYIHFFPNGFAERAIINFRDDSDEKHVSIRINPFNGETDVSPEYRTAEGTK
ncbi:MAG: type II secretion system protein [Deltaproteobacteria bacterium]|nr:type II secretion system protein [Deltaproteobacteria bacterium]MBI2342325.1 type II secretion system protein [Deltaproteobacteria bacterium]MBI2974990.1 type II secretion system protein [Deltaproteobacteria bacterium]